MDFFWQEIIRYRKKLNNSTSSLVFSTSAALSVGACGSGSGVAEQKQEEGFPASYIPPEPDYDAPSDIDPYAEILKRPYVEPYWVLALEMDGYDLNILPILT